MALSNYKRSVAFPKRVLINIHLQLQPEKKKTSRNVTSLAVTSLTVTFLVVTSLGVTNLSLQASFSFTVVQV